MSVNVVILQGRERSKAMEMQLKVIKADGGVEAYLHTKVIGTICKAFGSDGGDISTAERLAEVVTYFLYHNKKFEEVSSNEIFSIIKATLTTSDYEDAAIALNEHRFIRKMKRNRIEVAAVDLHDLSDAELLCADSEFIAKNRWNKSRITEGLIEKCDVAPQTARTIASMVEEKVFNMGITCVPVSLIEQLVWNDAALVLRAERQLRTV